MSRIGFKTQAQKEEENKLQEATQKEVQQFENSEQQLPTATVPPSEGMTNLHAETQDRVNQMFNFITGQEFQNLTQESKMGVLNDFRYYSQVEAKLQLLK